MAGAVPGQLVRFLLGWSFFGMGEARSDDGLKIELQLGAAYGDDVATADHSRFF